MATLTERSTKKDWLLLIAVIIITFICYAYILQNQFTGWDDDTYVTYNKYITSFSPANLKAMLFKDVTQNYYHPLTILSLALNYHFAGLSPSSYYLTNLLIHLANVCVIYFVVLLILKNMAKRGYPPISKKYWLAALCALWYGIHPMHVESVAWISERKDLLYAFFYFLSIICYIHYTEEKRLKWIALTSICYLLSCLSKPMGVVFPLSLFALDFLFKREFSKALFFEKMPMLLLSLVIGVFAFITSSMAASVASFSTLTLLQRILFPSYGFITYTYKFLMPVHLSSFYPYPPLTGSLPLLFYLAPFIALGFICIPLYISYKRGENNFRVVIFGLGFYLINLVFVLQFISVGKTIMSERYSYVSYFGLLFIVLYFLFTWMESIPTRRLPMQVTLGLFTLMFAIACSNRTKVWHNSETLWRDVIEKYPGKVGEAYESLANYYYQKGQMDSAYNNYKILSTIYFKDPYVFNKLGTIDAMEQQYSRAVNEFSASLQIDSNYYYSYMDRANAYSRLGKFKEAINDYNSAYRFTPENEKLLLNRGAAELNIDSIQAAIADFSHCLIINPGNSTTLYAMSLAYQKDNNPLEALQYAVKAKQVGYPVSEDYLKKLNSEIKENP